MEKTKIYTENKFTCIVCVFLDKQYKYDVFEDIPTDEEGFIYHEFADVVLATEYCRLLLQMNKDFLGRFLYKVNYLPIEESETFTNKLKFYTLNYN